MLGVRSAGFAARSTALDRVTAGRSLHRHSGNLHDLSRPGQMAGCRAPRFTFPGDVKPWWFSGILGRARAALAVFAPGVWVCARSEHRWSPRAAIQPAWAATSMPIGSNEATARLCGINVPLIKMVVYTIGGLATGLAGVLQFVYLSARRATRLPPQASSCK